MFNINILIFFSLIITACTPRIYIVESSLGEGRLDKVIYRYHNNGKGYFEQMMLQEIISIFNSDGKSGLEKELESSNAECSNSNLQKLCIIKGYTVVKDSNIIPYQGRADFIIKLSFDYKNIKNTKVNFDFIKSGNDR